MGKVKVFADFLPSPEELALKDETVKVTINVALKSQGFGMQPGELQPSNNK